MARIAVKGTDFEQASEHFKGVTALAWTDGDPVVLSKAISKFMKENAGVYSFKAGVVDGSLVDLTQLTTIANLPSKEELISKLLFVINAQAQRIVTVINAVPRDLAVVIKQIGEKAPATAAPAAKAEAPAEVQAEEAAPATVEEAPAVEVEAAADERLRPRRSFRKLKPHRQQQRRISSKYLLRKRPRPRRPRKKLNSF